jgi:DNA-binding transcriptional ArsR family regulator
VAVLRFLLDNPDSSRTSIVSGTGVSQGSASVALRELEELGYVTADIEGPRKGRSVRYVANRGVLTDDLTAFMAWMLR